MDYNTGWQYSVTGTNVSADGPLVPTGANSVNNTNVTLDGVTSQWTGLNLETDHNSHKQTMELETSNSQKHMQGKSYPITR